MNSRTKKWNACPESIPREHIEEWYLKLFGDFDYCYRVLKSRINSLFYAFENGEIISDVGEESYRTALRKHLLSKINYNVKNGKTCAIGTFDGAWGTVINELTINNISEFIDEYSYDAIYKKYGYSMESFNLHVLIDDWNQKLNDGRDLTKINPHDIEVSKDHDITFQELIETEVDWFHDNYTSHYFINGVPVGAYQNVERILVDGLVVGERVIGTIEDYGYNPFSLMAKSIEDGDSYIVIQPASSKNNLEENILLELSKSKPKVKHI